MKDPVIEAKVKALVGDNKLEEALGVMLAQTGQSERRHRALLLIKSRLTSLAEQELGGMISFDELSRQKAKIAHQILDIADGSLLDEEVKAPSGSDSKKSAGSLKFIVGGAAVLLAIAIISFFFSKNADEPVSENQTETQEELTPLVPNDTKAVEKKEVADFTEEKKEPSKEKTTSPTEYDNEQKVERKEPAKEEVVPPPAPAPKKVFTPDFPNVGRRFLYRDLYLTFQKPDLTLTGASASPKIKMKLPLTIKCRNNMGYCEREVIKITADGQSFSPTRKASGGTLENGSEIQDELIFTLPASASSYRLNISKADGNGPWVRGFKVFVN